MSIAGVEQVLYDVSVKRDARSRFAQDPDSLLSSYPLTGEERSLIKRFALAELFRRGVSPLLTMGFWMQAAPERSMDAYLRNMRQGDARWA